MILWNFLNCGRYAGRKSSNNLKSWAAPNIIESRSMLGRQRQLVGKKIENDESEEEK